jgi:hypothetical protein
MRFVLLIYLLTNSPAAHFCFTGDPDSPHQFVYVPLSRGP